MKILFFSPHAFWSVHSLPEALVAESLLLQGHEVVSINCDGLYADLCVCMPLVPLQDIRRKSQICAKCKSTRNAINREFGFRSSNIDRYVDESDRKFAADALSQLSPGNYLHYSIAGVPIARYALYELFLNHKLPGTELSEALWREYSVCLKNAILTYFGARKLIEAEAPDRITTYNSLYGVNRVVCAVADIFGIPHYTLHAGRHHKYRIQEMTIFKGIELSNLVNRHPAVQPYRERPLDLQQIEKVFAHVSELFESKSPWVYSIKSEGASSTEIRQKLGIADSQKVLLAVMRSNDERAAAKLAGMDMFDADPLFKSQYEWLDWLAGLARRNADLTIIFRVHPREYPNKRENKLSESAVRFGQFIKEFAAPKNLYINTPEDAISLHDLLKITDVMLNSTSTAGLEASLYGIPVLGTGDEMYSFDLGLQVESEDLVEYERNIGLAINSGWNFGRVIAAFRWLNYLFSEVAIDISDGYRLPASRRNIWTRALNKAMNQAGMDHLARYITAPVRSRSRPLKHADRLGYAIVNAANSHIGVFPPQVQPADHQHLEFERLHICERYLDVMKKISGGEDAHFSARIAQCLESCDYVFTQAGLDAGKALARVSGT